ncbi:MAG: Hsp20/alpha crystallin family protein, partial [Gammaproteobacteria bacterium]|nr:Hsp20/alpha crystallin family protein [Gammaproteobacteria bacterium]
RNMQDEFSRVFGSALPRVFGGEEVLSGKWSPNVGIYEDQNSIRLGADLPGMKAEDFNLSIENYKLTLTGERKFEKETKGKVHRVERRYGKFTRSFRLPDNVDETRIDATSKNGMLHLTIAKREEVKPRAIEVKVH